MEAQSEIRLDRPSGRKPQKRPPAAEWSLRLREQERRLSRARCRWFGRIGRSLPRQLYETKKDMQTIHLKISCWFLASDRGLSGGERWYTGSYAESRPIQSSLDIGQIKSEILTVIWVTTDGGIWGLTCVPRSRSRLLRDCWSGD